MQVKAIRTRSMMPPKDDLYQVLAESLPKIRERSVVVVTSKIVAIHQGRCVKDLNQEQRDEMAAQEADWYVPKDSYPNQHIMFTRKNDVLIASSGIDRSNGNGYLVLWPEKPGQMAREIHTWIKNQFKLTELGLIITDSHVNMMRAGVLGVSIGHFGFNPVRNYVGKADIFGRPFQYERTNVVDSLAVAAVLEMGEGNETTPIALIEEIGEIEFTEDEILNQGIPPLSFPIEEDLFYPMLRALPWHKGQGGLTREQLTRLKRVK